MDFAKFVLIFCNGDPPSQKRIRDLLPHPGLIACADGGANKAASLGYKPDIIVGDLDSISQITDGFEQSEIIKIASQDNTDFEKTLIVLLDRGFSDFLVVAFSGGRIDQTLANLQIAYEYSRVKIDEFPARKKCRIILADDQYLIIPSPNKFSLDVTEGTDISIIPMEDVTNVSTNGLEYELQRSLLRKGGQGISNKATGNKVDITVHKGGVLVFLRYP